MPTNMDRGEQNVIDLVNAWGVYSERTPNADLAGFCLDFLTQQSESGELNTQRPVAYLNGDSPSGQAVMPVAPSEAPFSTIRAEARLAALVSRLSRYAYFYSKKAMQPLQFKGIDDPVYLLVLLQMGTPKKSELIYEMMSEFASGIDIINRLVSMGLVDEFPDPDDRRSKRLRITHHGMATLQDCLPVMNKVADVAYSSLTPGEKALLIQLLNKLDQYHAEHFQQHRNAEFNDVYDQLVG